MIFEKSAEHSAHTDTSADLISHPWMLKDVLAANTYLWSYGTTLSFQTSYALMPLEYQTEYSAFDLKIWPATHSDRWRMEITEQRDGGGRSEFHL